MEALLAIAAQADLRGASPFLCGRRFVVFRSRETGAYYKIPGAEPVVAKNAVSYDPTVDQAAVKDSTARAIDFLKQFAKGRCVILTDVPFPRNEYRRRGSDRGRRRPAAGRAQAGRTQHLRRLPPRPA